MRHLNNDQEGGITALQTSHRFRDVYVGRSRACSAPGPEARRRGLRRFRALSLAASPALDDLLGTPLALLVPTRSVPGRLGSSAVGSCLP